MKQIHVAAGAIEDAAGRILITKRPDHVHQGGLWEFPGGKLDPSEAVQAALARELDEELGIRIIAAHPLIRVHHDYGDRHVLLDVHRVTAFAGEPHGREGQALAWVHPDDMDPQTFPAADRPIIAALRLPRLYLITGDDPRAPETFLARLERALAAGVRLVQLRAPVLGRDAYGALAREAFTRCEARGVRLLLNADPDLVGDLPCHGIHLTSARLWTLSARPPRHRWVGASCHTAADLARAADLGLDYALLSPVKPTVTHPTAQPLGWDTFSDLADQAALPVYALGGLVPADLGEAIARGAQGIAAIRGLWPSG